MQHDLQTKRAGIAEAIHAVEDLLTDKGDSLSPQERQNLQMTLTRMKEQYSVLTRSVDTSLSDVDTAITTAVKQNIQKVIKINISFRCFNITVLIFLLLFIC